MFNVIVLLPILLLLFVGNSAEGLIKMILLG